MTPEQPPSPAEFNQRIIEEFRANGGQVGGRFAGAPLVLLTTQGARTGRPHTNPVVYLRDGDRILVFASNAGGEKDPHWYRNLVAHGQATVEIGEDGAVAIYHMHAEPLTGAERDHHYARQAELDPAFHAYQASTSRTIPVVALRRLNLAADPALPAAMGAQLVRHHDELRRELARLRTALAQGAAPRTASLRRELLDHCLTVCDGLYLHHRREDGAFTAVEAHFPALASVIGQLREQHRVLAGVLAELRELVVEAGAETDPGRLSQLRTDFERMADEVEEHFATEEWELLPTLQGSPARSARIRSTD